MSTPGGSKASVEGKCGAAKVQGSLCWSTYLRSTTMFNWIQLSQDCAKGLLIGVNLIFVFIAVFLFGFAVVDMHILAQYGEMGAGSTTGDFVIIGASVALFLLAVFGCVGCIRNHVKMLYTYVTLLIPFVILELLLAIFVSIQRYGLQYRVVEWLRKGFFSNATGEATTEHVKLWDQLQTDYECCGLNGPEDYAAIDLPISVSCCDRAYRARTASSRQIMYQACIESMSYYSVGCEDEIMFELQTDSDCLFAMAVISFWLEAISMLLAMWVANYIKNSVHVYKHTVKY